MFTVTVSEKDGQQSTFNFDKPEIGIGRVKGNDIVLPKGNVSKRHSRIVVKDGKFIVIDLKSTNGTYVNGRKITSPQVIKSADKVYIGDFVLTVTGDPNSVGQNAPPPAVAPPGIQEMKPRPPSGLTPPPPAPLTPPPPQAAPIAPPPPQAAPITPPSPPLTPPPPARPSPSSSGALTPPPPAGLGNPTLQATPAISQPKRPTNSGLGRVSSSNLGATPPRPGGLGSSNGLSASSPSRPATPPRPQRPTGPSRPLTPPPPSSNTAPQPPSAPAPPTPVPAPPPVAPPDVAPARPIGQEMLSSLRTPGAGVIPPEPQFVSRFDQNFANAQVQIAEEFFGQVDPRDLPTLYPPTDEDRAQYEPLAQEILNRQGQSGMLEHLMSEIIGLGPLELLLDDAEVEEIYVNSHDQILYRKHDQIITAERAYSHPDFLYLAAQRLMGGRIDDPAASPVDEVRFSDGTRVHILMPPLAPRGPVLTVRKAPRGYRTVEQLVEQGVFSAAIAEFLGHAVTAGRSILIGGVMNTGRDELLNALGNLIPDGTRIVTIEESASLQLAQQSVVSLETGTGHQHHFDMRYLMRSSLRMRPERLLVNSLSGPEAYEWVTAAAGGTVGSMAVCNGVSSRDLLGRLESLCMMGGHDVAPRGLREQIARAVHLVIIMHRQGDGALRVHQISEVQGVDLDTLRVSDIFYFRAEQDGGSFVPTGYVPQFYEALKSAGIPADAGIFQA